MALLREVSSLERENLVVFDYFSVSEIWPDKRGGLIREVSSLERENLVVFDYFSVSEICYKRGGLIREVSSLRGRIW